MHGVTFKTYVVGYSSPILKDIVLCESINIEKDFGNAQNN